MSDQPALPPPLLTAPRELIQQGRQRTLRAVDRVQMQTREIGHLEGELAEIRAKMKINLKELGI